MTREVKPIIHLEQLEPRILLSGDGLLNIAHNPDQDTVLDHPLTVVQEAELLDTNEQVEEQISLELVSSNTLNTDVYQPIFTLLADDNTNDGSSAADLSNDNIGTPQISEKVLLSNDFEGDIENKVGTTEDGGIPTYINDADLSIEYATSIEIRGPPASDLVDDLTIATLENVALQAENTVLYECTDEVQVQSIELPGLYLVDPDVNYFDGQIVYLDFDGETGVTYHGPVVVEGIDIPVFSAESAGLAGQEQEIISQILSILEQEFEGTGVLLTTTKPESGTSYSTVYIGGDDSAFQDYGCFWGLAETIDVGNQDSTDNAFVFSNVFAREISNPETLITRMVDTIAHEIGHLLGYEHNFNPTEQVGTLSSVAVEYVVDSLLDTVEQDGQLTLREALEAANTNTSIGDAVAGSAEDVDIIRFEASLAGGAVVLSSELTLSDDVTIEWLEAETLSIDADNNSRILSVNSDVEVVITGLLLTGGNYDGAGGGVLNNGTLTLTDTTVSSNSATGFGGGIYNQDGTLTLTNATVSDNSADEGGGIYNQDGTLTLTDTTVSGNSAMLYGGGIYNTGTLTLTNVTVTGNSASTYDGGGIYNRGALTLTTLTNATVSDNSATGVGGGIYIHNGTLTLTDTTVSGNSATRGGGIYNANGTLTLTTVTVTDNSVTRSGGGIYNQEDGTLTLTNVTITGNSATRSGGGIFNNGTLTLTDTTVSGNTAINFGGGIYNNIWNNGTSTLTNATVTGNSADEGGGIYNQDGTLTLTDTTVSGNSAINYGGGINNGGTLTLTNTTVLGNSATQSGGGINNNGALTLTNATVSDNSADTGGGIFHVNGTLTLTDTTVSGNSATWSGGGIYNTGALTLTNVMVTGNSATRSGGGIYNQEGGTLTLTNVTITGNSATRSGGGIYNPGGTLTLTDTTVSGNTAINFGGGIYNNIWNNGTSTLTNATVTGNSADEGGGIYNQGGTLTLTNTTVSGNSANSGGGIYNTGTLILTNVMVTGNSAINSGGGISSRGALTLTTLMNSTVSGNSADEGGGIFNANNTLTLTDTTVSDNSATRGGGIYNANGALTLTNVTVSSNSATRSGGGIYNQGTLTLTNVTITGNSATRHGGGIFNIDGTLTLTNTTVTGNSAIILGGGIHNNNGALTLTNATVTGNSADEGGGIYNPNGTVTLNNTIVALSMAYNGPDIFGQVQPISSHNFIGNGSGFTGITDSTNGNLVGWGDPLFVQSPSPGPDGQWGTGDDILGDLHPGFGSPCIDAGVNALAVDAFGNPLVMDHDGRPRIVGVAVDIGAFENDDPPRVRTHTPSRPVQGPVASVQFEFSRAMDALSFDMTDDISSFTGPGGPLQATNSQWLASNVLEIEFEVQSEPGTYEMILGSGILDEVGRALDTDGDGTGGEPVDDQYTAAFTIDQSGPRIIAQSPSTVIPHSLSQVYFTFNEALDTTSLDLGQAVADFTGPNGQITPASWAWTLETNTLEIAFSEQKQNGLYTMLIGPDIVDVSGNEMDQDEDMQNGELGEDQYLATFEILTGPRIIDHTPSGDQVDPVSSVDITFDSTIDSTTFTLADIELYGPTGMVAGISEPVAMNGAYRISFPEQTSYGEYHLYIGPKIDNTSGIEMDQDQDGVVGEAIDDRYDASFTIIDVQGPRIIAYSPMEPIKGPIGQIQVTFNEPINAGSFDIGDVSISNSAGPILPTNIQQIAQTNSFQITFHEQSEEGAYQVTIGPNIQDVVGNVMDQDEDGLKGESIDDQYTFTFKIDLTGPWVISHSVGLVEHIAVRKFDVVFNEAIDASTFTPEQVAVSGPQGSYIAEQVIQLSADTFTIHIPPVEADGTYQIEISPVQTDLAGNLLDQDLDGQGGEDPNDVYTFEFVQQLPDLIVTELDYPAEALGGQNIDVRWTITNVGTGIATGGWTDTLYLSEDAFVGDDINWGELYFDQPLGPGDSYSRIVSVSVPDIANESRWIIMGVDSSSQLDEHGGNANNVTVESPALWITTRPYPDLQVTDVIIPGTLSAGEKAVISWTVYNNGTAATTTSHWFDAVYLSLNADLDAGDTKLAAVRNLDFLAHGEAYTQTVDVVIPEFTPRDDYFVLIHTDFKDAEEEFDLENNNVGRSPGTYAVITPELGFLTVLSVEVPSPVQPGGRIGKNELTWTIQNTGGSTIYPKSIGYWDDGLAISRDEFYDDSDDSEDIWLGGHLIHHDVPLAPGETRICRNDGPRYLPNWGPGTYYLILVPDTHWFAQSQGQDVAKDYGVAPITLGYPYPPDLQVTSVGGPATTVVAGQDIQLDWRVENQGSGSTRTYSWTDKVYLSSDQALDIGDVVVGSSIHSGVLSVGQGYNVSALKLRIPGTTAEGNYYLLVEADSEKAVYEENEANNWLVSTVMTTVTNPFESDLQIDSATAPTNGTAGDPINVEWTVSNRGPDITDSASWTDVVYLSVDASWDPQEDVVLGSFSHTGVLTSGAQYNQSVSLGLPAQREGGFHVFIVTDSLDDLYEHQAEGNNVFHLGHTIDIVDLAADLTVQEFSAPASVVAGQAIDVTWLVANTGTREASPTWQDAIYLSEDGTFDKAVDNLIGTFTYTEHLAIGASYGPTGGTVGVLLPDRIEGTYYLFFITDMDEGVYEKGSEQNNVLSQAVEVTDFTPDLWVQSAVSPAKGTAGEFITIDFTIINGGDEMASGVWYDTFFLSADTDLDLASDLLFGRLKRAEPVAVGQTYGPASLPTYLRLPDRIEGLFHVFVVADYENAVYEKNGEDNNVYLISQPIDIVLTPADLQVSLVEVPGAATAGSVINISWNVVNNGPETTDETTWRDGIYLSADDVFEPLSDIELGVVSHLGVLGPGATYSHQESLELRQDLEGSYYVYVVTDVRQQVFEHQSEDNNTTAATHTLIITGVHCDLQVSALNAPAQAVAGTAVSVQWTVANVGPDATAGDDWSDSVYLSTDNLLDESDVLLGAFPHNGRLPAGGSYTQDRLVTLPGNMEGSHFVLVKTDSSLRNDIYEYQAEDNNVAISAINLQLAEPADLQVTSITAPVTAWSGQSLSVQWTVTNHGGSVAMANQGSWYDSVYLSRDPYLDPQTDIHLGAVLHKGPLAANGGSYGQSLDARLPAGISGPYYVLVVTDTNQRVVERNSEHNNVSAAASTVEVKLTPPADLVATRISPPVSVVLGEPTVWEYEVTNVGTLDAVGAWYDTLYLSSDRTWDLDDARITRVHHTGDLSTGTNYTATVTTEAPPVLPGVYYLIVRTDILNQVRETAGGELNNTTVSTDPFNVDIWELALGVPDGSHQLSTGTAHYYKISNVIPTTSLLVNLDSAVATTSTELYISYGRLPSRSQFDFASPQRSEADQRLVVPSTQSGIYYVLAYGASVPTGAVGYSLGAEIADFSVYDTSYGQGGTAGNLTIEINGTSFDWTVEARLTDGGDFDLPASAHYYVDGTKLYATFDLTEVPPGTYHVVVQNGEGATATVVDGLEVVSVGGGTNRPKIQVPTLVRWGLEFEFTVTWGNDGLNDSPAPLLTVGGNMPFGFSPGDRSAGTRYTFLGTSTDGGPAGILRPGQHETMTFFTSADPVVGAFQFFVDRDFKNLQDPFDWDSMRELLRPGDMSGAEYDLVFQQLILEVGRTNGDFLNALARSASILVLDSVHRPNAYDILQVQISEATAAVLTSVTGRLASDDPTLNVAGRTVRLRANEFSAAIIAETFQDGSFILSPIPPGVYQFEVDGLLVEPSDRAITVTYNEHITGLVVGVEKGATISGSVYNAADGLPLQGATVQIRDISSGYMSATVSNGDGTYEFRELPADEYVVEVLFSGFVRQEVGGVIVAAGGNVLGLNFHLQQGASLSGIVISQSDGQPIEGARVLLQSDEYAGAFVVTTDTNGEYSIAGIPSGLWTANVHSEAFLETGGYVVELLAPNAEIADFSLQLGAEINGTVTDMNGISIAQAVVEATRSDGFSYVASTDETGRYRLAGLDAGYYTVRVDHAGYIAGTFQTPELKLGVVTEGLDVQLEFGSMVSGIVTESDGSIPVGGATLRFESNAGETYFLVAESDGRFVGNQFPAGVYIVRAEAVGFVPSQQLIEVLSSGGMQELSIRLAQGAYVSGTVLDADGIPIADALVQLNTAGGLSLASGRTDPSGGFTVNHVPAGTYTVIAIHNAYLFQEQQISLEDGVSYVQNFTSGSGRLEGSIRDSDTNAPVSGATVVVFRDDRYYTAVETTSLGDGTFSVAGLTVGSYNIVVEAGGTWGRLIQTVNLADGETRVMDIALGSAVALSGHIMDTASGTPIEGASVVLVDHDHSGTDPGMGTISDETGAYGIAGASSGTYVLRVVVPGWTAFESNVQLTQSTVLDISLGTTGFSLQGSVVDATTDLPVARAFVMLVHEDGWLAATSETDEAGIFHIGALSAAGYEVLVVAHSVVASQQLLISEDMTVNLTLDFESTVTMGLTAAHAFLNAMHPDEVSVSGSSSGYYSYDSVNLRAHDYLGYIRETFGIWAAFWAADRYEDLLLIGLPTDISMANAPQLPHCEYYATALSEHTRLTQELQFLKDRYDIHRVIWDELKSDLRWRLRKWQAWRTFKQIVAIGSLLDDFKLLPATAKVPLGFAQLVEDLAESYKELHDSAVDPTSVSFGDVDYLKNEVAPRVESLLAKSLDLTNSYPGIRRVIKFHQLVQTFSYDLSGWIKSNQSLLREVSGHNDAAALLWRKWASYTSQLEAYNDVTNLPCYSVSVSAGTGGTAEIVSGSSDHNHDSHYLEGAIVNIQAVASAGYKFVSWNGLDRRDQRRGIHPLSLEVNRNYKLTALFKLTVPDRCLQPNPPDSCGGGGGGGSHDPNDKLGPEGYDVFGYIQGDNPLPYTVRFENDPEATASAVLVAIMDQLDEDLDWSSFELGDMQFGDHLIQVPPGMTHYTTRIDLRPEGNQLLVDVTGDFDLDTGLAQWAFTGIDPATGELTYDPLAGFLPPNNPDVHDGEGFVQYSIYPKVDLVSGTEITNMATIVFDWNEPIDTPMVMNTIDAEAPQSAIDSLPAQIETASFQVSWAGADDPEGSGIHSYDIYVSDNGGAYEIWLNDVKALSGTFIGEFGHTYAFYSVARDNVGHTEPLPTVADAVTTTPPATARIGDRVWLDLDADGVQDVGEPGLADVEVNLYTSGDILVDTTITDTAGYYRFDAVDTGQEYYLAIVAPERLRFSAADQINDEQRDSDVDPQTGHTGTFGVSTGDHLHWDAGLYEPAQIQGVVWNDANENGQQDDGEAGLAGWTVFIDTNGNGQPDFNEPVVITDETGNYSFVDVMPGTSIVTEEIVNRWEQIYPGAAGVEDRPEGSDPLNFDTVEYMKANGTDIQALEYSVPFVVDWNNDNLPDLLVGEKIGSYGKIRVYLNQGTAGAPDFVWSSYVQANGADLMLPASGCLGVFPRVADWNSDGLKDLVLGLADGRVQVYLNVNTDDDPSFEDGTYLQVGQPSAKVDIDVGDRATPEIADWNNDGRLDLIIGALSGLVSVYINEGISGVPDYREERIVQQGQNDLVVPGGRSSPALADMNGDGFKDLVLGNTAGNLYVYLNIGTNTVPSFDQAQQLEADGSPISLATSRSRPYVWDLEEDGLSDIIAGGADGLIRLYNRRLETHTALYTTTDSQTEIFTPGIVVDSYENVKALELIELDTFLSDPRFTQVDGTGQAVVVIDTGIDLNHPFFGPDNNYDGIADRIVYQYDFAEGDTDASDISGHGSHVTSIVASSDPLYMGVAPGVDIIHLKVFDDNGRGYFGDVERALQWVIQNANTYSISAVNLSFGDQGNWNKEVYGFGISDELEALSGMGVIVVASAGNGFASFGSQPGVAYPAADPNTIAVGAVWDADHGGPWSFGGYSIDYSTDSDRIAAFSQRDSDLLDIFAPGTVISGADAYGDIVTMSGTSQAAPYVTGAAVLAQQVALSTIGRSITPYEFQTLLHSIGRAIVDGDDEDDNVINTGLTFRRLDMLALAEAIQTLDPDNPDPGRENPDTNDENYGENEGGDAQLHSQPFAHTVSLISGEVREHVDFGNKFLNNSPVAHDDDTYSTYEDTVLNVVAPGVLVNDSDLDGDHLTAALETGPSNGIVTLNTDGSFTYTPYPDYFGPDSFSYKANDSWADSNEAMVTITVNPVNDVPVITDIFITAQIDENGVVTLAGQFTDPDTLDSHRIVIDWADSTSDTLTLTVGERSFSATHQYLDDNPTGTDQDIYSVNLILTDDNGGSDNESKTVTVNNVAPTAAIAGSTDAVRGQTLTFSGSFTDAGTLDTHTLGWVVTLDQTTDGFCMCEQYGKPAEMTLLYNGTDELENAQGSKADVFGDGDLPDGAPVYAIASKKKKDGTDDRFFAGQVEAGDYIVLAAGVIDFGANTFILFFDPADIVDGEPLAGAEALRTVQIHTSCSAPLILGDTFAGVQLVGYMGENGTGDTLGDDPVVVATGAGPSLTFTPDRLGTYTVTFTVTDDDGGVATTTHEVVVDVAVVGSDPDVPGVRTLFVGGSDGRDKIDVKAGDEPGWIKVKINEKDFKIKIEEEFAPTIDRIVVYGRGGNDDIKVHKSVGAIPAELYGGNGDDKLGGGQGHDVLVGGDGDDLLAGKDGRDLLIGGLGKDKIVGDDGDDILIGGVYVEGKNRMALNAVMAEWTRFDLDYDGRIANLLGIGGTGLNSGFLLNDTTVLDDAVKDKLSGKKGLDWFLGKADDDKLDVHDDEQLTEIEIIFLALW